MLSLLILPLLYGCFPSAKVADYKKYEPLVEKIRKMNLSASDSLSYRLDDLNDFSTLRKVNEKEFFGRGQGAGCVSIRISEDKKLTIVRFFRIYSG